MRRFSFMIFALAVLFAVIAGRRDNLGGRSVEQSASTKEESPKSGEPLRAAAGGSERGQPGQGAAPQQSDTESTLLNTAATLGREGAPPPAEKSGFITSAPGHVSASAKSGGIDPALEGLAGRDLNSALQGELKRLGCYDAKVDGKWGRKSEAAVEAFGQRAGGAWEDASRRELVVALRNYPAAFCATECAAKTADGQCAAIAATNAAVSAPNVNEGAAAGKDTSYLPPWMQDAKLSNVERPEAAVAPAAQNTLSDVAPVTSKPRKSKSVRRRGGDGRRNRNAQRYERRRVSSREWLPQGWPGAR